MAESTNVSYHGDAGLKARFVGHVLRHQELDMVAQGSYGEVADDHAEDGTPCGRMRMAPEEGVARKKCCQERGEVALNYCFLSKFPHRRIPV